VYFPTVTRKLSSVFVRFRAPFSMHTDTQQDTQVCNRAGDREIEQAGEKIYPTDLGTI
jgi:hypothetical protein